MTENLQTTEQDTTASLPTATPQGESRRGIRLGTSSAAGRQSGFVMTFGFAMATILVIALVAALMAFR